MPVDRNNGEGTGDRGQWEDVTRRKEQRGGRQVQRNSKECIKGS